MPSTRHHRTLIPTPYLSLFFQCYADHRALHSFPTRRSSDLRHLPAAGGTFDQRGGQLNQMMRQVQKMQADMAARSEEHTSELQSRFDLVCRLLLEKKKKNN